MRIFQSRQWKLTSRHITSGQAGLWLYHCHWLPPHQINTGWPYRRIPRQYTARLRGALGGLTLASTILLHFMHQNVEDAITILYKGTVPHTQCEQCYIFCTSGDIGGSTPWHRNVQERDGAKLSQYLRQCHPGGFRYGVPISLPDPIEVGYIQIPHQYSVLWWKWMDWHCQEPPEIAEEMGNILPHVGTRGGWYQDLW